MTKLPALALLFSASLGAAESPAPVRVASVTTAQPALHLRLTGTLTAERNARLSPRVDGLVARVRTDAGDSVKAGDTLIELDATLAKLALDRTEADVAQARVEAHEHRRLLEEARRLAADKHIPQSTVETRQAEANLADAALASSEAARREQAELVRRHTLIAPFDGVVTRKLTEAGEWVARGTAVLELVATDRVRLDVFAPQERFRYIDEGATVEVHPDALPGATLSGRVDAVVPVSDQSTRNFLVRILIADAERRLPPGTSATAMIRVPQSGDPVVLVPRDALLRHVDGGHSVFTVESAADGSFVTRRRNVKIGATTAAGVEVLEGLDGTERVITRGNESLRDGQPVQLIAGS